MGVPWLVIVLVLLLGAVVYVGCLVYMDVTEKAYRERER